MKKMSLAKIAVIVERSNSYARRYIEGVAAFASAHEKWQIELFDPSASMRIPIDRFDGFICRIADRRFGKHLARLRRPVVESLGTNEFMGFVTVRSDITAVSRLASDHFLQRRHSNFAYCGFDGQLYSELRMRSFSEFVRNAGFTARVYEATRTIKQRFSHLSQLKSPLEIPDARTLRAWLEKLPKPSALFCCNDRRAFQVLNVCRAADIRVPQDIAILGVDDDPVFCAFSSPRLSSIDPDAHGVGYGAATTLAGMLGEPGFRMVKPDSIISFPPKGVIARTSTAAFPVEPEWLSDALVFIRQHVSDNISASDVFAFSNRSHATVDAAFRQHLGTSVQKEIANARLESAKQLLSTSSLSMKEISQLSGFSSPEYFCRCFTASFGISPTDYRQQDTSCES